MQKIVIILNALLLTSFYNSYTTWTIDTKDISEKISFEWIDGKNLREAKNIYLRAHTDSYLNRNPSLTSQSKQIIKFRSGLEKAFEKECTLLDNSINTRYCIRARSEKNPIGFALFEHELTDNHCIYIAQLVVDTPYQKKGLGKKLLFAILEKVPNTKKLTVVTRHANKQALSFYTKLGFKQTSYKHEGYNPSVYAGLEFERP